MESFTFKRHGYRWDCTSEDGVTIARQRNGTNTVHGATSADNADVNAQIDALKSKGKLRPTAKKDKPRIGRPKLDYVKIKEVLKNRYKIECEGVIHYSHNGDGTCTVTYVVASRTETKTRADGKTVTETIPTDTRQHVIGPKSIEQSKMDLAKQVDNQSAVA